MEWHGTPTVLHTIATTNKITFRSKDAYEIQRFTSLLTWAGEGDGDGTGNLRAVLCDASSQRRTTVAVHARSEGVRSGEEEVEGGRRRAKGEYPGRIFWRRRETAGRHAARARRQASPLSASVRGRSGSCWKSREDTGTAAWSPLDLGPCCVWARNTTGGGLVRTWALETVKAY